MNFPASLAALGFLAACCGTLLSLCALAMAAFARKCQVAQLTLLILACGACVYFGLLFGFSLGSRDHLLSHGPEKYFCEIDCHLAYSVTAVKAEPASLFTRYLITLRTRFDETTISSLRPKDAPLSPSPRTVQLIDSRGAVFPLESASGPSLATPLIPGQSYTTQLSFRIPSGARDLRLLVITTPQWPDHVVIGDENSWLHKKTYFAL
ncbi:MAG: hypothetical protein WBX03_15710 [Terriglobales bacterium]|jgi:hypothetical protein